MLANETCVAPFLQPAFIATFGPILGTVRYRREWAAPAVALYVATANWFTSSTQPEWDRGWVRP